MMNIRPEPRKLSSPSSQAHMPQLRLPPTRHSAEPLSLVRPSSASSSSTVSSLSSVPAHSIQAKSPVSLSKSPVSVNGSSPKPTNEEHNASLSEPLSLVSKPKTPETPENLCKKPEYEQKPVSKSPPSRPDLGSVGTIRVRPAEALSPVCQPPLKKPRQSPSPRLQNRPPSSSPIPQSTSSPRPSASVPSMPPGFPPSLAGSYPGMIPSSLASLYSPYSSPYLSALAGGHPGALPGGHPGAIGGGHGHPPTAPGAPCTDPMCRDPTCPTYQLRAAQTAQLMALSGLSLPPGYPGYPPMAPGLPGMPPSMMSSYPGATPPGLPGMLPPSLLAPPAPGSTSPFPPASLPVSTSSSSLPTVGGASQFMCSWMQGRDFCGRRFNSSEELMSHLRTHTANMGDTPSPTAATPPAAAAPPSSALALLQAQAAQLRGQVSPQSTASTVSPPSFSSTDPRLHPYLRPGLTPPNPSLSSMNPSLNPMLASLYGSPRQLPVLP